MRTLVGLANPRVTDFKAAMLGHNGKIVEFKADARNTRSQQALLRLGATQEGVFRKHMTAQNEHIRDSVYFSIIDDEWPELKARLESKL